MSNSLENLKKEYIKTKVPSYLELHGWEDIAQKLTEVEEKGFSPKPAFALAFAVMALLVFTSTLVFASQPSKPGDNLYQVKILSDKIYSDITGDYQTAIDKRAQEVIELKDEPNSKFDEAIKEYQRTLDQARDKSKDSKESKKEQLRQQLDEQAKKFQEISKENTKNQQKLQNVVDQTKRTRGEVKGDKDSRQKKDDSNKKENQNTRNDSSHENND